MTFPLRRYFLALGAGLAMSGVAMAQDISVAVVGPMTGSEASFGQQFKNGAELAVAEINAAGGLLGRKLKLEVGDDACDPKQAVSVAEKMAGMKIPFVAGHFCSSASIPASEAYAEGNVLQITPGSTNPQFTERGLWNTFRVCGRDDQQGMGKGLADETRSAINAAGVREKLYEAYNKGDKDFAALVSRFKKEAIDLVYVGGYYSEAGLILRQMRDQGINAVLMGGDALVDMQFAAIAGPLAEGSLFTFAPDPRKKTTAAAIIKKFKDKGIDPDGYTLYSYAAFQVWSEAVARAKTTDAKKVAAVIKAGSWDSVLGKISYTPKGDITVLDYVVYRRDKDGSYAELQSGH
ncbi:MAG: branched-chain amino acid ABC transporter substrate-binding protein [Alphaproteobacteria bacterium]|nr:MAG: branched-chain amino acid ABC transporter substrate-binding protein [Alphaproteobacteria bacterium]